MAQGAPRLPRQLPQDFNEAPENDEAFERFRRRRRRRKSEDEISRYSYLSDDDDDTGLAGLWAMCCGNYCCSVPFTVAAVLFLLAVPVIAALALTLRE